jgi:hypothetical protein
MKTFLKIRKILLVATVLILATNIINAQGRTSVYMGQRLPQMTAEQRDRIPVAGSPQQARGQLIFNIDIDALEYWDGSEWVSIIDQESILTYIIDNFSDELGDKIIEYITNNFTIELGDVILEHITNHFTDELGDKIIEYITNNVTQELTDNIMANVAIASEDNTVTVVGSGTSDIDLSVNVEKIAEQLVQNQDFIQNLANYLIQNTTFIQNLENALLNSTTFIEQLITKFISSQSFLTQLATNEFFIDQLISNKEFITQLVTNEFFVEQLISNKDFITQLVTNEFFIDQLVNNNEFIDMLISNNYFIEELITNLTTNNKFIEELISNEYFIDELFKSEYFIQELITNLTTNNEFIEELISNNFFIEELFNSEYFIENLITNITENIDIITNIIEAIAVNITDEFVESIMAKVSIDVKNGLLVEGSGTSKITISLPKGQEDGQLLVWSESETAWIPATPPAQVRQLAITFEEEDGKFSTENLIFYGKTDKAAESLKVVSIEPVFENITHRRHFLRVDASYQVNSDNSVDWTVSIENRNISPANENKLLKVIISYITEDTEELGEGTHGSIEIIGF